MSNIRAGDMVFVNDLFEMRHGYVLDFSNSSFSQFFVNGLNLNIDDPMYAVYGPSKGKRLRCFLQKVDPPMAVKTLKALWEYREAIKQRDHKPETVENAYSRLSSIINRLEGKTDAAQFFGPVPKPAFDRSKLLALKNDLIGFTSLPPQKRGYAFETFLHDLFNVYGLKARKPFRLIGEQIDGSFVLQGDTYLLEAKWQSAPTGAADLHIFHGKLEQKAAWARGLFVSDSGFTEDGLAAFGRGKRVICMDGLDLSETLSRELPLDQVLDQKARRATETGQIFARVRDLLPA